MGSESGWLYAGCNNPADPRRHVVNGLVTASRSSAAMGMVRPRHRRSQHRASQPLTTSSDPCRATTEHTTNRGSNRSHEHADYVGDVTSPRITVVGSVNLDLVARCHALPRPGETITASAFSLVPGGKGANQALAAQRMGGMVRMVARVGRDSYGTLALADLRAGGVELSGVHDGDVPTGIAMIVVDDTGENEIVVVPGANSTLTAHDVRVQPGDAVLVQLEVGDDALIAAAEQCAAMFVLNAAPSRPVPAAVLRRADVVIVNRLEAEALGSTRPGALVAITYGAQGAALFRDGVELARANPPPVHAVDGTAAGDAFCGAFVVALLQDQPDDVALRRACAAGALAASRPGAQPSLPTAAEVDAILGR